MDGWTSVLLAISAYAAVSVLVRWMIAWHAQATEHYRAHFNRAAPPTAGNEKSMAERSAR